MPRLNLYHQSDDYNNDGELTLHLKDYKQIDLIRYPQNYFLSYQPVTLQLKHLNTKPEFGELSILSKTVYSVTDKADGERHLLFVDDKKDLYLINNRHSVKYIGKTEKQANTVIDGEFIKYDKYGELINKFMCFDIYFCSYSWMLASFNSVLLSWKSKTIVTLWMEHIKSLMALVTCINI